MTFSEAYRAFGPDVERISDQTGIAPHEVDRLINAEMNRRYAEKIASRKTLKVADAGREPFARAEWGR